MSAKSELYNRLKNSGYTPEKHYRDYTLEELQSIHDGFVMSGPVNPPTETTVELDVEVDTPAPVQENPIVLPRQKNPNEMAGERLNTQLEDEPIRIDENGFIWYQEEVRKPAAPQPRGRRVLKYIDTGTRKETFRDGEYVETIEVAGDGVGRPAEVKITLPSYQVGIYRDPRYPFKIHVYNETRGFNYFDVVGYYGGEELVPPGVKTVYVENVLCYDIRSVIQAIQQEFRALQLSGKVN